jgi:hypothetical protein
VLVTDDHAPTFAVPSDSISGALGHVILAGGPYETGEAVAIWHLTPTGRPSGAWITGTDEFADSGTRIRALISGRALLRWGDDQANELSDQLDHVEVLLADCLVEISEHRAAMAGHRNRAYPASVSSRPVRSGFAAAAGLAGALAHRI